MNNTETLESQLLSERIKTVPRSFIRDILKVANAPGITSFAGGLPNKEYFPVEAIKKCTQKVLSKNGSHALQYSNTEGLLELRKAIADQYQKDGLNISEDRILITSGSQQALDLIGKIFINKGDTVLIEKPSYLGAIQAMSMYQPNFQAITLEEDGLNINLFREAVLNQKPKLTYVIPNFQNPTGISYSEEKRKQIASLAIINNLLIVEDDPYGAIRFNGKKHKNIFHYAPENTILLGSFSKTIAPGFRIGWIVAPKDEIFEKLVIAKQASDLHTDIFSQRVIATYLNDYNTKEHINIICKAYGQQAHAMINAIEKYFPFGTKCTRPEGGMFCWVSMPKGFSSLQLFEAAIKEKVAVVPGAPFYINEADSNDFRLNFSCSSPEEIVTGITVLAKCIQQLT